MPGESSEVLEIIITPQMKVALEAMLATGYFGDSLSAVAERLLGQAMFELVRLVNTGVPR